MIKKSNLKKKKIGETQKSLGGARWCLQKGLESTFTSVSRERAERLPCQCGDNCTWGFKPDRVWLLSYTDVLQHQEEAGVSYNN